MAPAIKQLTERQQAILDFIRQCALDGMAPSFREIMEEFGFRSLNSVAVNMKALEAKGHIIRDARFSRGIRLTNWKCPHCGKDLAPSGGGADGVEA